MGQPWVCKDGRVSGIDQAEFGGMTWGFFHECNGPRVCVLFQVRTGLLMNLMGIMILNMAINTWAQPIFQLGSFPDWAQHHLTNVTGKPPSLVANDTSLAL